MASQPFLDQGPRQSGYWGLGKVIADCFMPLGMQLGQDPGSGPAWLLPPRICPQYSAESTQMQ